MDEETRRQEVQVRLPMRKAQAEIVRRSASQARPSARGEDMVSRGEFRRRSRSTDGSLSLRRGPAYRRKPRTWSWRDVLVGAVFYGSVALGLSAVGWGLWQLFAHG